MRRQKAEPLPYVPQAMRPKFVVDQPLGKPFLRRLLARHGSLGFERVAVTEDVVSGEIVGVTLYDPSPPSPHYASAGVQTCSDYSRDGLACWADTPIGPAWCLDGPESTGRYRPRWIALDELTRLLEE